MENKKHIGLAILGLGGLLAGYNFAELKKITKAHVVLPANENTPMNQSVAEFDRSEKINSAENKLMIGMVLIAFGFYLRIK